jgi:hypothetical protein
MTAHRQNVFDYNTAISIILIPPRKVTLQLRRKKNAVYWFRICHKMGGHKNKMSIFISIAPAWISRIPVHF